MIQQPQASPPADLSQVVKLKQKQRDSLIAAGSPIGFETLYNRQTSIPLVRKKYYSAKDVDRLLVLMNGVITKVVQSHHRSDVSNQSLREELTQINQELENQQLENTKLSQSNIEYAQLVRTLQSQIDRQGVEIQKLTDQVDQLTNENQSSDQLSSMDDTMTTPNEVEQLIAQVKQLKADRRQLAMYIKQQRQSI